MAVLGRSLPQRAFLSQGSVAPGTKIQTLQDDFNDNVVDTTKWPGNYGTYFETSGFAVAQCDTGFSGYQSARNYSLVESEFVVQCYSPVRGGATVSAFAEVNLQSDQQPAGTTLSFQFDAVNSVIWAFVTVGFADIGTPQSVAYTPGSSMWVRFKETGGVLSFYASSTGTPSSYGAAFRTLATPAWVTTSGLGVNLQAHRNNGTTDFASFDNVNLGPADPPAPQPIIARPPWRWPVTYPALLFRGFVPPDPPPPAPIIVMPQSGRRPFPLPPGAKLFRGPDLRPPPSNRVAVGLDGSMPLPLAVRLTTSRADVLLVEEVQDLSWRSVVPGGFASATVTLSRPLDEIAPEIATYGRMYVYDTRDGSTVWEGRVEDKGKSAGDQGNPWQVTAVGPSASAKDESFSYLPIDSSVTSFERFGGSLTSATVGASNDASGNDGLRVAFAGGVLVPQFAYVSGRSLRIQNAGLQLASVAATATGGGTGQWTSNLYVYGPGSPDLVDSVALTTTPTAMRGVVGSDFASGQYSVHLRMDRTGAAATPADDNANTMWTDVVMRTTLVDEEGNPVSSYANDYVLASEIVQDLIGSHLPMVDGLDAFIEDTTLQITQLAYDSTTVADILGDLMALEGAFYWASWETIPRSGKWRFEWRAWPTTVKYEAGVEDGWESPGSAADLYNEVRVSWKDSVGRTRSTLVTATVDALDAVGLTRSAEIDLGQEVGTAASAASAGQAFLDEHNLPSQGGRLTIARPILNYDTGTLDDPWKIRPGGTIRLRGIDAQPNALNPGGRDGSTVFRIMAVSFRASDGTAELELDSDALSTSKAIALLKSKRTRR